MENTAEKFIEDLSTKARVILIGGLAVIAHGFSRTTKDIDIWMEPCADTGRFSEILFTALSFSKKLSLYDLRNQSVIKDGDAKNIESIIDRDGVMRIVGLDRPIDVFRIPNNMDAAEFENIWARSSDISKNIKVLDEVDLLLTKEDAGRSHDLADITFLESKIRKKYCDELKNADYARAMFLFSRYYDYATCGAALENKNEDVRKLSIKYLNELKDSGDPFAIEILNSIKQ